MMLNAFTDVSVQPVGFPIIWTGDYVGIIKRGLPGGYLYPTWTQPIQTASSCVACNNGYYNDGRVMGARVLP